MSNKFKVGDKVKVIERGGISAIDAVLGDVGKIIDVNNHLSLPYLVEFEKARDCYHDGNETKVKGKPNHCYWCSETMLELIPQQKIVITTDGTETLARLYEGNKVVKSATAKCCPEDTFNFEIGAKLAFRRLIGEKAEKAYYTGKAVCVETDISSVTVGKVYDFAQNDGCGINDNGNYILDYPRKNLDEINKAFRIVKFIQYVE